MPDQGVPAADISRNGSLFLYVHPILRSNSRSPISTPPKGCTLELGGGTGTRFPSSKNRTTELTGSGSSYAGTTLPTIYRCFGRRIGLRSTTGSAHPYQRPPGHQSLRQTTQSI